MPKKTQESPLDFRSLPLNLKLDRLTKMYLTKCTNVKIFSYNPRKHKSTICPEYGKIRYTLGKCDEMRLNALYDYLWTLGKEPMDLTQVFTNAESYRQQQMVASDKAKSEQLEVKPYDDYSKILGEWGVNI